MDESVRGAQEFSLADQDEVNCPTHGWLSHAAFHEAAHATFAVMNDIEFSTVSVFPYGQAPAHPSGLMGGGVRIVHDGRTWVPGRQDVAFDFAVIGSAAERHAYGHFNDDGRDGDREFLRVSMGWGDSEGDREIMDVLIEESEKRLERQMPILYPAIGKVFLALIADLNIKDNTYTTFDKPLVLTSAQVSKIVGSAV